jgi:hypothetical protein
MSKHKVSTIPPSAKLVTLKDAAQALDEQFRGISYRRLRSLVLEDMVEGTHYVNITGSKNQNRQVRLYLPAVIEFLTQPAAFR